MDFGKLTSADRNAAIAAAVVAVTSVLSIAYDWGLVMVLPLLAGIGALLVIFLPQRSSGTTLPGSKGSLLVIAGAVAAVIFVVMGLTYLEWLFGHLATFDAIQFLAGLVASLALAWFGWQVLQAEGGRLQVGAPAGSTPPAPATPPAPSGDMEGDERP
jgi:hypothetical protein